MEEETEKLKGETAGDSSIQQTDTQHETSDVKPEISNEIANEDDVQQAVSDVSDNVEIETGKDVAHEEEQGELTSEVNTEDTEINEDLEEENITISPEVIDKLTTGVLGLFLPNLQKARGTLNECLHNQEVLMETVQQENAKFTESTPMQQLINTMQQARVYHNKLINLKREMNILTDRSAKIKKRAVRLQQQRQKEELEKAAQRDRENEKERMLSAKVAKDPK